MKGAPGVLFVEDEAAFRRLASSFLEERGLNVTAVGTGEAALQAFDRGGFGLVLLDLNLPDMHGVDVLRRIRARDAAVRVVVLTAYGDARNAVTALKAGATDYLTKPIEFSSLLEHIQKALGAQPVGAVHAAEPTPTHRNSAPKTRLGGARLIGEHPAWKACLERMEQVIDSGIETLLLLGESGTGKSVLAQAFHASSPRAARPFVEVDCPAIPEALLESELFGHERGAFTGATARKRGQVELAQGGTLFLDEIGELPLTLQPKLLRFLERRRYRRVGGEQDLKSDLQLVCATNRELLAEVERGGFRRDLFYRLEVASIRLPPLRERGDDVVLLAERLACDFASEMGRPAPTLSESSRQALLSHSFPGNIRELRNLIRRAVAFVRKDSIDARDLDIATARRAPTREHLRPESRSQALPHPVELEPVVRAVEAHYLGLALARGQSQTEAAALLGLDRFALARRRKRASRQGGEAGVEAILGAAPDWVRDLLGDLPDSLDEPVDLSAVLALLEEGAIAFALKRTDGNRSQAAAFLGISRPKLLRRLQG